MLDTLIQSKTRLKLLLRFFLNPETSAHMKGLAQEFDESTKTGARPSTAHPILYQEVNVAGSKNMLEVARKKDNNKFVSAYSSSVYGKNLNVPWKEDDAVLQPISLYASTKVIGDLLGHVYSHLYWIRFIALRFFLLCKDPDNNLISQFINS